MKGDPAGPPPPIVDRVERGQTPRRRIREPYSVLNSGFAGAGESCVDRILWYQEAAAHSGMPLTFRQATELLLNAGLAYHAAHDDYSNLVGPLWGYETWWHFYLTKGEIDPGKPWPESVPVEVLLTDYVNFPTLNSCISGMSNHGRLIALGKAMRKVCPLVRKPDPQTYQLPPLKEARAWFARRYGCDEMQQWLTPAERQRMLQAARIDFAKAGVSYKTVKETIEDGRLR
jgi:hypothetical protein